MRITLEAGADTACTSYCAVVGGTRQPGADDDADSGDEGKPDMVTVGVLAQFEFTAIGQVAAEEFFRQGQLVVEGQPDTTQWFAYRLGPTTYGAFAVFASEQDRDALLSAGGPKASRKSASLFERDPTFEKVDIVAARVRQ
jgi:hypothetical protein